MLDARPDPSAAPSGRDGRPLPLSVAGLLHDGGATLVAAGQLTQSTSARLTREAHELLCCRPPVVTLDLRAITFADDLGAACLLAVLNAIADHAIGIRIHARRGRLLTLIDEAVKTQGAQVFVDESSP